LLPRWCDDGTESLGAAQSQNDVIGSGRARQIAMKPDDGAAVKLSLTGASAGEFGAGTARTMANFQLSPGSERSHAAAAPGSMPMDMSADTGDLSLVRRVQAGERAAYDLLVLKYQHKVVKLVMRYLRNPADAEDVAQEAFIKAYRALPQFRGDSAFYTWLYRIAINTAKNALVSRERNPVGYELDAHASDEGSEVSSWLRDPDTPEGLALSDEIRDIVQAAIGRLPEDLRAAIVLRELEGLSYEEIALTMNCPVGTVRSRIFRAREAIDGRLREVFDGGLGRTQELK
jgi:RNA polymerase sigma-70 factor (ECF subfamily)